MKRLTISFCCLCCLFAAHAQNIRTQKKLTQIDTLIREMLPASSEVGVAVYDLTARVPLYSYQAEKLSRPASTMKLITAITALARPDADQPFRTEVWHDGSIVGDTLQGNLYVVGGFDPEFDSKMMDALTEAVAGSSFSVINGQVYGDVSMKDSLYWGLGWSWNDNPEPYQPYLSPLMFCKGTVEVTAIPRMRSNTASLSCNPVSSYYTLVNQMKTGSPRLGPFKLTRDWMTNGNRLVATGHVNRIYRKSINIYDSGSFFMHSFVERLRARGIKVAQEYAFAELPSKGAERIACLETPMQAVIDQMLKESDNLNAEAVLCRIGAQATGRKHITAKDGIAEILKLISKCGLNPKDYKIADGSGLSNYDYLSPTLLLEFLKYAYSRPSLYKKLYEALPIGGVNGTLEFRMKDTPVYRKVHAKTGSITAINALAGYIDMPDGHVVAFAIMNQNVLSAQKARDFQDKVCEVIYNIK